MHCKQFLYILPILFLVAACNMNDEGCLDIKATNFDASADKNCCCVYPEFQLNVTHKFDEESFRVGEPFTLNGIDTFIVEHMTLLFSEIHPVKSGVTSFIEDTIHLEVNTGTEVKTLELEDNFIAIKPNKFAYPIGTFPTPDTYDGLEMVFGLEGDVNLVNPDSVYTSGHVLESTTDTIWSEEHRFFYIYMDVIPDYNDTNTKKEIILSGEANKMDLDFSSTFVAEIGYDFGVDIQIDYKLLFNGIDFVGDDSLIIANKVKDNLITSLSVL